jgi:CRISPR-associated endonuclease/helicase Cas3
MDEGGDKMIDFFKAFEDLTGNPPFPWQTALYERFLAGNIPQSCNLPTGLGKTNVIAIWLIAFLNNPTKIPRRLVYVVNRRTVVDQTTNEVEKIRENLKKVSDIPLAISTLRGQFADNREWSADPSRPAVICGTVDMIGSRLLFSGYGVGFKGKPLHAGFLGQDALLVHDEAHLAPAFQKLIEAIKKEQCDWELKRPFRVLELSATSRANEGSFELTPEEKSPPDELPEKTEPPDSPLHVVWRRIKAKKSLNLIPVGDDKQAIAKIITLAESYKDSGNAVLIFVRTVDAVGEVQKALTAKMKAQTKNVTVLTGTLRGWERDKMPDPRRDDADTIFARFLKPPKKTKPGESIDEKEKWKIVPQAGTVFLICTSAGEVGIDISADHLISDLMPFDSMAQRFGRVNRYGMGESKLDVVYTAGLPTEAEIEAERKKEKPKAEVIFDGVRRRSLDLLGALNGDASPFALGNLPLEARIAAFSPQPEILPVSDILFDAWALTTIKGKLPGRPPVEMYLHGISQYDPPQTTVAWRVEVELLSEEILKQNKLKIEDILEMYPLKPQEELSGPTHGKNKVFEQLEDIAARDAKQEPGKRWSAWVIDTDGSAAIYTLEKLVEKDKQNKAVVSLGGRTVILPPCAGGLSAGLLKGDEPYIIGRLYDVSGEWYTDADRKNPRRTRVRNDEAKAGYVEGMRPCCNIDLEPESEDTQASSATPTSETTEDGTAAAGRYWHWYVRPKSADDDGSKNAKVPISWKEHTNDVVKNAGRIAAAIFGPDTEFHKAFVLAAKFHDLGKRRVVWQRSIGNPIPTDWYAKSGKGWKTREITDYRHEFGSLLDLEKEPDFLIHKDMAIKDLVRHLIAVHHGYGRPHFPEDQAFDPTPPKGVDPDEIAREVPRRFARLQRSYGRWGLAYLESLLRAADWAASANPTKREDQP